MFNFLHKKEVDYKKLLEEGATVVDVRSKEEFTSGHFEDALNIPLFDLTHSALLPKDKSEVLITCCQSGGRSNMAKSVLEKMGYKNVYNGGGWQRLNEKLS